MAEKKIDFSKYKAVTVDAVNQWFLQVLVLQGKYRTS